MTLEEQRVGVVAAGSRGGEEEEGAAGAEGGPGQAALGERRKSTARRTSCRCIRCS